MLSRRFFAPLVLFAAVVAGTAFALPRVLARTPEVPAELSDKQFWTLVTDASEPGGYFRSANVTNLTSNELWFQHVIPDLLSRTKPGGVYLGVGPEQNYTYMAALRPKIAIIFDIRRGNLDLQLMYKAIFELAKDRADFVSMLFSKPRPEGLGLGATAGELFTAFARSRSSETLYQRNLAAIEQRLTTVHGFPLAPDDLLSVEEVYQTFFTSGFSVRPSPTYADLMMATDANGVSRSYLASEDRYLFLQALEAHNLVIPVVGNFEGPKAIRAVGKFLKPTGGVVAAFYLSNVEQYLTSWDAFCGNVASLPLDSSSTFIRSTSGGGGGGGGSFISSLGRMAEETQGCRAPAGGR